MIQDNVKMAMEEEWCGISCGYALQAIVANAKASELKPPTKFLTPAEAYPMGDTIFLLTQGQYYGCIAAVSRASKPSMGKITVYLRLFLKIYSHKIHLIPYENNKLKDTDTAAEALSTFQSKCVCFSSN